MAKVGKNMGAMRRDNYGAILTLLHEKGGMSRKQIAANLHLTAAAITVLIGDLIKRNILREVKTLVNNGSAGRKEVMVDFDLQHHCAAGISFGIEQAVLSIVDLKGNLLDHMVYLFDGDGRAENIIQRVCSLQRARIRTFEEQGLACIGVGVALRGVVDENTGICENSYGTWGDSHVPVVKMVQTALPEYDVVVRHNLRAMAEAHIFVSAKENLIRNLLLIKSDTGIGAAMVINQEVYTGHTNKAAEIGHLTVKDGGRLCRCGRKGCLETYASYHAIVQDVTKVYGPESTPKLYQFTKGDVDNINKASLTYATEMGDEMVCNILQESANCLGTYIRTLIGVLDMEKIALYGAYFYIPYIYESIKKSINYDGRYPNVDDMFILSERQDELLIKCSAILAINRFYQKGGDLEC